MNTSFKSKRWIQYLYPIIIRTKLCRCGRANHSSCKQYLCRGESPGPRDLPQVGSNDAPEEARLSEMLELLHGRERCRLGKVGVKTAQGSKLASSRQLQRGEGHTSILLSPGSSRSNSPWSYLRAISLSHWSSHVLTSHLETPSAEGAEG